MTICQLLLNLFFAALSAFLGVLMGLWYSKFKFEKQLVLDRQNLRRKLIQAFKFNVDRLDQMAGQLTQTIIPDFRFDTESVAHVLFHGRELFDDESWFERFDWQRYQLVHLNSKVELLNDIINAYVLRPDASHSDSKAASDAAVQARFSSLAGHIQTTKDEISKLIEEFEASDSTEN